MKYDDLLMCAGALATIFSIVRSVNVRGGMRVTLQRFVQGALRGEQIILIALVMPLSLQVVYYTLTAFSPEFRENTRLREAIIRPSIFTTYIILGTYFLNGHLVCYLRTVAERIQSWKMRFHM